jgi:hypothetical protein
VPSTGARCPACDNQTDDCERCGGRALAALAGPASVRGLHWAEGVVRTLVGRWPLSWPRSQRALSLAATKVADLAPGAVERQARLARICLDAAARRYVELTEYLAGRRLVLPREPSDNAHGDGDADGDGGNHEDDTPR